MSAHTDDVTATPVTAQDVKAGDLIIYPELVCPMRVTEHATRMGYVWLQLVATRPGGVSGTYRLHPMRKVSRLN